jgi:4-hydroxy-3-polyprenylbenzoate decarboxylase
MATYTLAITGASGSAYGVRLLECLLKSGARVCLCITREGSLVIQEEIGMVWAGSPEEVTKRVLSRMGSVTGQLSVYHEEDFMAPIASGSVPVDAMMIVPCSMKTIAAIAAGGSTNLVERAADVTLKERRPLVVVPRETPLSPIHLRNLLTISQAGVHVLPAMPAFYQHPKSIEDLVDFIVGRVLDSLKIEHRLYRRWTAPEP